MPINTNSGQTPQSTSTTENMPMEGLADDQEFFIPIHGLVRLTDQEVAIVNHSAFQRLADVYQLGQSHLVYRGATHTRFEHSIGTVHAAQQMIDAVEINHKRLGRRKKKTPHVSPLCSSLSQEEKIFTRLGALLHDIGHIPAGHTLEDELGILAKHDEVERLNHVLKKDDWAGGSDETLEQLINTHYEPFLHGKTNMKPVELLLHIITKPKSGIPPPQLPESLRIQVMRDMVGDTICADLLDYLYRDWYHIGKPHYVEPRLFEYMEIRKDKNDIPQFVISIGQHPRIKTDAVSTILQLLESRYNLAEAVLFHRTKCAATAMLERAIYEIYMTKTSKQKSQEVSKELEKMALTVSDKTLITYLISKGESEKKPSSLRLLRKIHGRRIYKAVYTISHSHVKKQRTERIYGSGNKGTSASDSRVAAAKGLEADFNLPEGSVAIYCPTKGMNAKIAKVRIHTQGEIETLSEWDEGSKDQFAGGHLKAQIKRFQDLWRLNVFVDAEEWKKLSTQNRKLFRDTAETLMLGNFDSEQNEEEAAFEIASRAVTIPDNPWFGKQIATPLGHRTNELPSYPTGTPWLRNFFLKSPNSVAP